MTTRNSSDTTKAAALPDPSPEGFRDRDDSGALGLEQVFVVPEFTLESGHVLRSVPIAFRTWGTLNETGTNAVVVCHTVTGDTNVDDWWDSLLGPGKALDPERHFVICANAIGSPYGTVSPLTTDPATALPYGPDFPAATVRDSVRLHGHLLDNLGVRGVEFAIGGSMGGMQALEWAFDKRVQAAVAIGVGAAHSAWCIGWSETQRQAIFSDPAWRHGQYDQEHPPAAGLATARMIAMMSYRSFESFEDRFARKAAGPEYGALFATESYLRHHGKKLVDRFDANCYVHLTQQMDSHDVGRDRNGVAASLGSVQKPVLVVGIDSDVLYPLDEQRHLSSLLPQGELAVLSSLHGHDGFLIETESLNDIVHNWYLRVLPNQKQSRDAVHEAA